MYTNYFGFKELPFSLTPDTTYFYRERSHEDSLRILLVAIEHGEGFVKLVGEVGTGKTLLCRRLLAQLEKPYLAAYIPNPMLEPEELKWAIATELDCDVEQGISASDLTNAIQQRLLDLARSGTRVVTLVDEAQAMPQRTLEGLRLLSNLETQKRKLLQVILVGQPELDALLNRKELRQLKQRITFSERLSSLRLGDVHRYIEHRTTAAGQPVDVFSHSAALLIGVASGGIARLINIVCHKALLLAYSRGDMSVKLWHVAKAVLDTEGCTAKGRGVAHIIARNTFAPAMRASA